jgi:hypothetical protein
MTKFGPEGSPGPEEQKKKAGFVPPLIVYCWEAVSDFISKYQSGGMHEVVEDRKDEGDDGE